MGENDTGKRLAQKKVEEQGMGRAVWELINKC